MVQTVETRSWNMAQDMASGAATVLACRTQLQPLKSAVTGYEVTIKLVDRRLEETPGERGASLGDTCLKD
eukprot:m.159264 g.159264  ORF g.159264 m.159264 type:complete len:70 (-) comp16485_c0_seq4:627-836(-)